MLLDLLNFKKNSKILEINQSNIFYNYAMGADLSKVDLVKTAAKLLKAGVSKSIFLSDFKYVYLDEFGKAQIEFVKSENRKWDSSWKFELTPKIPTFVAADLISSLEIAFHENQFSYNSELYLRAPLPPIVLDGDYGQIPIFASVKIHSNGIAILSFQFDASWQGLNENDFIYNVVNIYQRYCKSIWVDSRIQQIDADIQLKDAFEDVFSFGDMQVKGKETKKIINEMKADSQKVLDNTLKSEGKHFELGEEDWVLHPIAGSENIDSWESTLELCSSMYFSIIRSMMVSSQKTKQNELNDFIWQGRPSVSLLRFNHQPQNKKELLQNYSKSINKILLRASNNIDNEPNLPPDLRAFEDYSLHANRSVVLWTWLRAADTLDDAWDEPETQTKLFENQARAEQIEYYNMYIARACHWAHEPPTANHLLDAYEILTNTERLLHQSSKSGEVSDAISYLIDAFGTKSLIPSAKEAAKFHLDRLKYQSDTAQSRNSYWLTVFFGLLGATSFAEFVIYPFIQEIWPALNKNLSPLISFCFSALLLIIFIIIIRVINKKE